MTWPQDTTLNAYFGGTPTFSPAESLSLAGPAVTRRLLLTSLSPYPVDLSFPDHITPLLDPMQMPAPNSTSSSASGQKPLGSVGESKGNALIVGPSSASSRVAFRPGSSRAATSSFSLAPAVLPTAHHETLQSLMKATDGLKSWEHADPIAREGVEQCERDESKRSTGRTIRSIRSGFVDRSQSTSARFLAARKAILADQDAGPTVKDLELLAYYSNHHVERYRSVVAAEFAALDQDGDEAMEMPLAQLRLLEIRPDLLTPTVFARVYARLLNGLEVGVTRTASIDRLSALNRAYPNDSNMLGAMRKASHDSGLMTAEDSAAWVRQLFSDHSKLVTANLLNDEFTALHADRQTEPRWFEDSVKLFESFPGTVASIDRAVLSARIESAPALSAAEKLMLHNRMKAASAALEAPAR